MSELMSNAMKETIKTHEATESFMYMLMDRMKQDCNYYLGNGNRCDKYLWGQSVIGHIADMKALWNNFPEKDKPEWLSMEDIRNYERKMSV